MRVGEPDLKAIIVGGGIGGLTAALCLHAQGIDVDVLEQSPELGEVGAGIQLSPNAMRVFEQLGLAGDLIAAGFVPRAIDLRMGESGLDLISAPLADVAEERWGAPYVHIHRADLLEVLSTAVEARIPGAVKLGFAATHYECVEGGICVRDEHGNEIAGDVVIGADGIHSVVRVQMLGPDAPTFTGNVAWRAVVPVDRLGADAPDPVVCAWMGRGKHAVTYRLRGGKLANLVAVVERDDWKLESWSEPGDKSEALQDFEGWHPTIVKMLSEADTLYRWALFDRAPLPSWSTDRVALMGDAAHPMLPFMAQGAAMAIEDAWVLGAALAAQQDIPTALQTYETLRKPRATRVQAGSRANAKRFHHRSLFGRLTTYGPMWLAGRVAPKIGLAQQDWVYSYDVLKDASSL